MTVRLRWLLVAAVVAVAAVAGSLFYREQTAGDADPGFLLFPHLDSQINNIAELSVTRDGSEIRAQRTKDGEWILPDKAGFDAAFPLVRQAALAIAGLRAVEEKSNDMAALVRMGLTPPNIAHVTLKDAAGAVLAELDIGSRSYQATDDGPVPQAFVRPAGQTKVWLARGAPDLPRDAGNWLEDELLSIDRDRIRAAMTITPATGAPLQVTRATPQDQDFRIENLPIDQQLGNGPPQGAANGVGLALANLRCDDVMPMAQADFTHAGHFAMRTFDGLTISGQVAQKDGQYWISLAASYAPPPAPSGGAVEMPGAPPDGPAEAARLAARFQDRAFRVPDFKGKDLTRTLTGLAER